MGEITPEKLLTDFLVEVGNEQTECTVDSDGAPIMISKAEMVARTLYLMATGGHQERKLDDGSVQIRDFKPSIQAAKLIREWTEGRPSVNKPVEVPNGVKRPGQFSKEAGSRLSRVLGTDVAANNNSTGITNPVSKCVGMGDGRKNRPSIPKKA